MKKNQVYILGISCNIHQSAATLIKDGILISAAEEERFTRKKYDSQFPQNAINYWKEFFSDKTDTELTNVLVAVKELLGVDSHD